MCNYCQTNSVYGNTGCGATAYNTASCASTGYNTTSCGSTGWSLQRVCRDACGNVYAVFRQTRNGCWGNSCCHTCHRCAQNCGVSDTTATNNGGCGCCAASATAQAYSATQNVESCYARLYNGSLYGNGRSCGCGCNSAR